MVMTMIMIMTVILMMIMTLMRIGSNTCMRMMSHQRLPKPRFEIRAEQNADGGGSVSKSDDGDVDDGDVDDGDDDGDVDGGDDGDDDI